jgi:prephenate dehydratase
MIKISIQGARGSFHDIVARKRFPGDSEILESDTFKQVFEDVKKGFVDYGVVAIENSIYGSFLENYDLLLKYEAKIAGEAYLRIELDLIALPGVKMQDLKEVYTHPMAMSQAEDFLEKHPNIRRIETHDTAAAARLIKNERMEYAATIGSHLAADIYGLRILAKDIETEKDNYTRFLIISKDMENTESANKTSLVIRTQDKVGSLYRCLKCFADEEINLSKLESRPVIGRTWVYNFYLDFEKGLNHPATQRALNCLKKETISLNILGTYENHRIIERDE